MKRNGFMIPLWIIKEGFPSVASTGAMESINSSSYVKIELLRIATSLIHYLSKDALKILKTAARSVKLLGWRDYIGCQLFLLIAYWGRFTTVFVSSVVYLLELPGKGTNPPWRVLERTNLTRITRKKEKKKDVLLSTWWNFGLLFSGLLVGVTRWLFYVTKSHVGCGCLGNNHPVQQVMALSPKGHLRLSVPHNPTGSPLTPMLQSCSQVKNGQGDRCFSAIVPKGFLTRRLLVKDRETGAENQKSLED
ncbi:LOW QUALITY PROTEIN: hypothetical protein NC652_016161 [Populus alba x Populus x berolinensis]|nr:LOW QUALITY PROTEIN: hypothetical protein NC652_016161 [Populus alba x Populus x berolinensis]